MSEHECKYYKRDSEGTLRCDVCGEPSTRDKMQAEIGSQAKTDKAEVEDKAVHAVEDKAVKKTKRNKKR